MLSSVDCCIVSVQEASSEELKNSVGLLQYEVEGSGSLVYEGDLVQNKKHGHGILTWPNGRQYKGQFADDIFHGEGTMAWPDGTKYVGHYANGKKDGEGSCFLPDDSMYYGQFCQGKRHGKITYVKADGTNRVLHCEMDKVCEVPGGHDLKRADSGTASSSAAASESTSASSRKSVSSRKATPQNPQRWRVVDIGGAVVRATPSLKSSKLGIKRQNEELVVVEVSGRRLRVASPFEECVIGWVSAETDGGLKIMERIDDKEQSERSATSASSAQSLTQRLFAKIRSL